MKRAAPVVALLLLAPGVPALGISAWYAWTFVVGHSVWSIAVPIALVELLFPDRAPPHLLALVAAALMTYAGLGFVLTSLVEPSDPIRWAGSIAFAAVALVLVIAARRRIQTVTEQPQADGSFAQL